MRLLTSTAVAITIPLAFAVAPYFGVGIAPHATTPAGIVRQGCSQVGCPLTPPLPTHPVPEQPLGNDPGASL